MNQTEANEILAKAKNNAIRMSIGLTGFLIIFVIYGIFRVGFDKWIDSAFDIATMVTMSIIVIFIQLGQFKSFVKGTVK